VIGTAGHIDHGKTALVRALTGIDTDRLPEEKRRGITVDLGFASLTAEATDNSPLRLSFIDVPGHALFVRNMLAGAGGIDAVMLVISAEEGVKPQTEEHLAICTMLGIERGLTVITKTDAVSDSRLRDVLREIERFLSKSFLAIDRAPIVPVSAHTGTGMDDLRRELAALGSQMPDRDSDALTRLPLDRAFVMKGFGTVVTGTLIAGSVKLGQSISVEPGARIARIRGIQVHGQAEESSQAGSRVALNLAGIDVSALKRGDTLVEPSNLTAVDVIDVEISLLPNSPQLKHRARVHFHAYASESMATISLYGYGSVESGGPRLARLRLSKPIVLLPGDRFVIRQGTPITTMGGGRVLDANPIPRTRKAASQAWLQNLTGSSREQQFVLRAARRGTLGITLSALSRETGIKLDALQNLLDPLTRRETLVRAGDYVLTREALEAAHHLAIREFALGANERGDVGLKRSELKSRTRLGPEVLDLVLSRLEAEGKLRLHNELVVPIDDGGARNPDQSRLSAIATAFESAGLAAPSPDELVSKLGIAAQEMRRLVTILLRDKTLIRLGSDSLCIHRRPLADLTLRMQALRGQTIDISAFKQLAGVSRKYAIPLLEYFDRERITRKQEDHRIIL
jgi:selenocysteine-specific elongation factor